MPKKISCLKCIDKITENECVIDERCNGCVNLKAAKNRKNDKGERLCPERLEEVERDYTMTTYHFSDEFISDIPKECSRDFIRVEREQKKSH